MSSDLVEMEDDADGNSISFSMKASGHAHLCVSDGCEFPLYEFEPNETGSKRARELAKALNAWADHVTGGATPTCRVM